VSAPEGFQHLLRESTVQQEIGEKLATSSLRECHWMAYEMLWAIEAENSSDQKAKGPTYSF